MGDDDARATDDDDGERGATVHEAGFGWCDVDARSARRGETVGVGVDDGCRWSRGDYAEFATRAQSDGDDDSGDDVVVVFAGTTAFAVDVF